MMDNTNKAEKFYLDGAKLLDMKEYQKAKRKFDYAIKYDDKNPFYYYLRSKVLKYLKKEEQSLVDIVTSIKIYNEMIIKNPSEARYHDGKALALELLGSEFDIDFEKFQELNINIIPGPKYETDAEFVIRKFMSIFKDALQEYDTAITIDSENIDYRMHRASMKEHLANDLGSDYSCMLKGYFNRDELYSGAMEDCDFILGRDKNNIKAFILKIGIFQDLERYEEAIRVCDDALNIEPHNSQILFLKAFSLRWLERYEDAMEQCDRILGMDPDNADAHYLKGDVLYSLRMYQEAIKEFDASISSVPGSYYAHFQKGNALVELNRYDEALKEYDIAIGIAPYKYSARFNKFIILRRMGKKEEADKEFSDMVNSNRCVLPKLKAK